MTKAVLDASAFLAYLGDEQGAAEVEEAIAVGACLSSINWAEVLSKLSDRGKSPQTTLKELSAEGLINGAIELFPFTADDALSVAQLRNKTKAIGMSLADRACIALALRLNLPAITSDRSWLQLKSNVSIRCIR
jgi:PIN domain nuclease of toxin-antitoxin system